MRYAAIVLFLLMGCATAPSPATYPKYYKNIHPKFRKKFYQFEQLFDKSFPNVTLKFERMPKYPNAGGVCFMPTKAIIINKIKFDKMTRHEQEEVVFHELGHCALGLYHSNEPRNQTKCPKSIMFWRGINNSCYIKNKTYYLLELIKRYNDSINNKKDKIRHDK